MKEMKTKLIGLAIATLMASSVLAGEKYTIVGVILDNKGNAVKQVQDCLRKVGIKDVSIGTSSPNPPISVLKTQAEKARKALKKSKIRLLIYEQKKK
jgi:hypothetical protein